MCGHCIGKKLVAMIGELLFGMESIGKKLVAIIRERIKLPVWFAVSLSESTGCLRLFNQFSLSRMHDF